MKTIPLAKSGRHIPCLLFVHVVAFAAVIPVLADVPIIGGPVTNSASGHIYYLLGNSTWTEAEAKAVSMGGHLVAINDAAENDWVVDTFSGFGGTNRSLWIGFSDSVQEESFAWSSGESVTYTNWRPGEPNGSAGPGEDYAYIYGVIPGFPEVFRQWNDIQNGVTPGGDEPPLHGVVEMIPLQSSQGVPAILSIVPDIGSAGTFVSIVGTNFSPVTSANVVRFGAVQANVVSGSETNLTVTVPVGATYAPVTVTVDGLTAYSSKPFLPTFAGDGTAINSSSLAARFDLATPSGPIPSVIADLDGDGKPDLAVGNGAAHRVSLFRNIASSGSLTSSSFETRVDFAAIPTSDGPYDLTAADVDGDGKLDLVFTDRANNRLGIYRNTSTPGTLGGGTFGSPVYFAVGSLPCHVVAADLDGDGRVDLVSGNHTSGTISILRNTGSVGSLTTNSFASRLDLNSGAGAEWRLVKAQNFLA